MTTPAAQTNRIATFKMSAEDYAQLERVAQQDERSVSAVLRLAVRRYLEERQEQAA